jgi:hypothetical protein
LFYVLLTALISCSGDGTSSSTYLTFENLHQLDQDLKEALVSQKIKVVESDGDPETTEYALIINGDSLAADNLKTDEHVISYLKKEKGLLIVNATSAHREALAKILGFFSGDDGIRNYYIHIMPGTYGRHLRIIHFPEVVKPDFSKMSTDNENNLHIDIDTANNNFEKFKSDFEKSVDSQLFAQDIRKYIDNDFKASQIFSPTESIPGNLKHYIFYSNAKKQWRFDNFWWETWNRAFFYTVTAIYPAIPPMEGYQTGGHEGSGLVSCIKVTQIPQFLSITNFSISQATSTYLFKPRRCVIGVKQPSEATLQFVLTKIRQLLDILPDKGLYRLYRYMSHHTLSEPDA